MYISFNNLSLWFQFICLMLTAIKLKISLFDIYSNKIAAIISFKQDLYKKLNCLNCRLSGRIYCSHAFISFIIIII